MGREFEHRHLISCVFSSKSFLDVSGERRHIDSLHGGVVLGGGDDSREGDEVVLMSVWDHVVIDSRLILGLGLEPDIGDDLDHTVGVKLELSVDVVVVGQTVIVLVVLLCCDSASGQE